MKDILPEGKLDADLLKDLLETIPAADPRVTIGARQADDAAAIAYDESRLVVSTDPITFQTDRPGWYAVNVNANDVAAMGATPRWFLATIMLPAGRADASMIRGIFSEIIEACTALKVTLCGGHTEVTSAVTRPVVVGQMMGEVHQEYLIDSRRLSPGDQLVLTGGLAIEGTAILANELGHKLKDLIDEDHLASARKLIDRPGISVVRAARIACDAARLKALHDLTEGGLASACHELCRVAGVGMELVQESILVHPETQLVAHALGLDPLGMLASGSLLIGVSPESSGLLLSELDQNGIHCCVIGNVTDRVGEVGILRQAERRTLDWVSRDEILKAFDDAPDGDAE